MIWIGLVLGFIVAAVVMALLYAPDVERLRALEARCQALEESARKPGNG
jgi:hypothetical protein